MFAPDHLRTMSERIVNRIGDDAPRAAMPAPVRVRRSWWMALMGVARVRSGEHWPSDVPGGYFSGVSWRP